MRALEVTMNYFLRKQIESVRIPNVPALLLLPKTCVFHQHYSYVTSVCLPL